MRVHFVLLICWLAVLSCSKNDITPPPFNPGSNLAGTTPIKYDVVKQMEGIYALKSGSDGLGVQFVCKISKNRISFFSNKTGIFLILSYGLNPVDSSIQFAGSWRSSESTDQNNVQFSIAKNAGASDLLNHRPFSGLELSGFFLDMAGLKKDITLSYTKAFSSYVRSHEFTIFGHHGVLTTANPPFSQNSLNAVLQGEDYGLDGLEFDLRLTKDHVPICIHNKSIDVLLTQKSPLSGDYSQYSFAFLQQYIRLLDGQTIPSVAQVLQAFIDSTNMKYMWLDIKGDPDVFKYVEPVVRDAYTHAAAVGRQVVIIADMPSQEVIDEFAKQPSYLGLPTMCEETLQKCIDTKSMYFGPRYTLGLLPDDVDKAHSMGIKVYSWTLNSSRLIRDYLQNGKFDGFITDYPAYVVYDYYTMF